MKSGFSIGRAFAGFLLGSFVITLLLAGAGVWWAGKQAFVRHQDAVLRSDLRAVAEAQRRLIDAHTRGLDYLARRPLVAQAVMGEERSLADLADFLRAFDIDPGILRVEIYDILLEPLIAQGIASGGRSRFPAALRRVMAEEIIESGAARLFNHARAADGEVLLIALPVESYGVAEGALVAELLMPRLLPVTEWKSIARVEIVGRHEMADLPKAVATPGATPGAGTIEGAVADAGGERIILEIPGTSLLLAVTPDRSALGDARTHLLVTSLVALAAALSLAFLAAYVVGHQAIVGPQRALEISRRRLIASEAKAREMASIVQQINDAIVLTDAQGRVTWCNAAVEEISGYSLAEMIGRKPGEVLQGPDTDRATTRAIGRALRARRPHRCEILNYRKTGEPYWLDLNLVPLFDSAGLIRSFVAIERDVTEAKERERQLADAREAAEAATRAKSNFLANMSHEIRTPMNGIVGMADLLSETPLGNAQALYVDTIRESASALLTIINDILDLSKVEAGRVVLAPEPVDIAQLMEEVARLLAPAATERGLEIVVDDRLNAGDGFRRIFRADRARLRQILINLAGNACKFTERGHVVLGLSGPPQATGATAALTIVVRDSGIGIPADRIGDIFHAFEQADNATERRFEGTGLGLAITQRLVGLMGGTIAVTSTLGEGSVFTARLGLVEEEVVEAPAEEPRRPVRPASPPPTRTPPGGPPALRVAVVSPVAAARQLIAAQLRLEGIATVEARALPAPGQERGSAGARRGGLRAVPPTGADAPAVAEATGPGAVAAVVVDDAAAPGDAAALLAKVRQVWAAPETPVVLLAAVRHGRDAARLVAQGYAGVHLKPLRTRLLARQVAALAAGERFDAAGPIGQRGVEGLQLAGRRILIAEDGKTNRLVLAKMLEPTGAVLDFRVDGAETLAAYFEDEPDLVLMDCSMPVMSGYEASRRIRERLAAEGRADRAAPIVAVTANVTVEDQQRCFDAGMDRFLGKPVRKQELFAMLAEVFAEIDGAQDGVRLPTGVTGSRADTATLPARGQGGRPAGPR